MVNLSAKSTVASASSSEIAIHKFKLDELEKATNNFDDSKIIVRDEFGITYKGLLDEETVAVKRYNKDECTALEFGRKIMTTLSRYYHPNIVPLFGICEDRKELILVQEFMMYGSLADHLFGEGVPLSWEQRIRICIDAARGLEYLHIRTRISGGTIHRNINPAIILLDENWTAKLSDIAIETEVKGPYKYLDPHYNLTGQLTRGSDMYAFGVVLFDVLFGRKDFDGGVVDQKKMSLGQWTQQHFKDGSLDETIDDRLKGQISLECLKEFVELASSCVRDNPTRRPTVTKVGKRLESILKTSQKTQP